MGELPELDTTVGMQEYWMTRLVDLAGAIAARGIPARAGGHGARCRSTTGAWPPTTGRGSSRSATASGRLTPGGAGRVGIDVHDLAALYTGFAPARVLARRGLLRGATEADVDALAWAFGSPTPWMREYF